MRCWIVRILKVSKGSQIRTSLIELFKEWVLLCGRLEYRNRDPKEIYDNYRVYAAYVYNLPFTNLFVNYISFVQGMKPVF